MRTTTWVAAALVAVGCGGRSGGGSGGTAATADAHTMRPDAVCGLCTVRVSGGFTADAGFGSGTLDVTADPGAGGGFGGVGTAATGEVVARLRPDPLGPVESITILVDTIEGCTTADGIETAVVSGSRAFKGTNIGRATATVTATPTGLGTLTFVGPAVDAAFTGGTITSGTITIDAFDRCGGCGEGECVCADTHVCEPCAEAEPPTPVCREGTHWRPELQRCEPDPTSVPASPPAQP